MLALVPEQCMHPALASVSQTITIPTHFASAANTHPDWLRFVDLQLFTLSSLFKIHSASISNPPVHLAHAPIIDSLTFVIDALAHDDSPYSGSLYLHQQVLINSSTPSTSALPGSLPQPPTTPTALGSRFTLESFRQSSAAPDNPAGLSAAFGSLRSLQQPSAVSASLRFF